MESSYTPDWCKSLTFNFNLLPGYPATHDDPGCSSEVEFTTVDYMGEPAQEDLQELLIEQHCKKLEEEILERQGDYCAEWEADRAEYFFDQRRTG